MDKISLPESRAVARKRVVELEGGCNFRDIGGYTTQSGQSVRWGRVYRTAVLSYFTDNDHAPLLDLGVRAICDLRRGDEREREPTRWPDASVRPVAWRDDASMPTIRGAQVFHAGCAGRFEIDICIDWCGRIEICGST